MASFHSNIWCHWGQLSNIKLVTEADQRQSCCLGNLKLVKFRTGALGAMLHNSKHGGYFYISLGGI